MANTKAPRILVIEDEALIGMLYQQEYTRQGFEVLLLSSGEEAGHRAEEFKPDIVTLDISLSGELDGIETADAIRQVSEAPIFFITGYDSPDTREAISRFKPCHYLLKPVRPSEISRQIKQELNID